MPDLGAPELPPHPILRRIGDPVVVIFVLAGAFDLLSGDFLVHGLVLLAVAAALLWDSVRGRRHDAPPSSEASTGELVTPRPGFPAAIRARRRFSWAFAVPALLYAAVVGTFARYSWPASIAVLVPAGAAVAVAWRRPSPEAWSTTPVGRRYVLAWAAVFVSLALWELAALLLQPSLTVSSYDHPTVSVLMDSVLGSSIGRSVFLALWLGVGSVLLER
jgi:hypothetical protein